VNDKPYAITLDPASSLLNHTGAWRTRRPRYVSRMPPCNHACPAGEASQAWLALAEEGKYLEAWQLIVRDNPFPAVMGRVCYHPCEQACNRGQLDEAVGINSVERFLGDLALRNRWRIEPGTDTGKRVMIVGAGPAGLACAWHLRRFGHDAVVFDANPLPGGMMRYAIPHYRMPRETLTAEIARIEAMGVEIQANHFITDLFDARDRGGFDALFVAGGAQLPHTLDLPKTGDLLILDALRVLRDHEEGRPVETYGRVVVYGGGNTAVDVARSAVRLGASHVTVVTRETAGHMAAHESEVSEALGEGIDILNLRSVERIEGGRIVLRRMSATNVAKPRPLDEFEDIEADVLVLAVGQVAQIDFLQQADGLAIQGGRLAVDENMYAGIAGVFAGGDMTTAGGSVTAAIGHGKRAARAIDAWLRGAVYAPPERAEVVDFGMLETWYYSDAPRTHRPRLDLVRRTSGFAEVVGNLDEETAAYEARRCMSCGNCFECDNCYGVCPDNAVTKLGAGLGFEFEYDYCKGCGLCESECPCGAIEMVDEIT